MSLESSKTEPILNPDNNRKKGYGGKWDAREQRNTNFNTPISSRTLQDFWVARCGADVKEFERIARLFPRAKMALRIINDATFWVDTEIVPNEENDYDANPRYHDWDMKLINEVKYQFNRMKRMYRSLRDSLRSHLAFGMGCGFSIALKVWQPINGRWQLVALKVKKPWDFDPYVDDYGNLESLWHYPSGQYVNPNQYVLSVWPYLHGEQYLGISEIEPIKAEVEMLLKNQSALAQYIHNTSVLGTLFEYDTEAFDGDSKAIAIDAMKRLQSNSLVEVPGMYDENGDWRPAFKLGTAPDRASAPVLDQLSKMNAEDNKTISRTIGIGDDLGVTTTQGGAFAKSKTVFDVFLARPYNAQIWSEDAVNGQIITDIIQFNYPSMLADPDYLPPMFRFKTLDEEEATSQSQRILAELAAGLLTMAEAREQRKYPPLQGDADKLSPLADAYPEVQLIDRGILDANSKEDVNLIRQRHGFPPVHDDWKPLSQHEAATEIAVSTATDPANPDPALKAPVA